MPRRARRGRRAPSGGRTATRRAPPSARRAAPDGIRWSVPSDRRRPRSITPVPTTAAAGRRADARRRAARASCGQRDVVGVQARDVAPARLVEPDVERAGEAERPRRSARRGAAGRRHAASSSPVPSIEPSSTTTSSRSRSVWPSTLATASPIVASRRGRRGRPRRAAGHRLARRVACAGARSRAPELRPRRRDRRPDGRARRGCSTRSRRRRTRAFRVLVVDQNADDRVAAAARVAPVAPDRARCARRAGSRARGTPRSACSRPTSSRSRTTTAATRPTCSSASPRASPRTRRSAWSAAALEDADGRAAGRWPCRARRRVDADNVWHTANSHTIFLRRDGRRARRAVRRGARPRRRDAVVVGRGDRLPRARAPRRRPRSSTTRRSSSPIRSRPTTPGRARRARAARRRERRLRARTQRLPGAHGRADARPARGRRARLARPARHDPSALPRGDASRARLGPALRPLAPLSTRARRRSPRAGRASRRARTARPPGARALRVAVAVGEHARRRRRRAPPASAARRARTRRGAGRRCPPRRRRARPCRRSPRTRRAAPHAIASITVVGHGSFTFVWSRTCARRKTSGASACA